MHANGTVSGIRDPDRPNWWQVAKAKKAAAAELLAKFERRDVIYRAMDAGFECCAQGNDLMLAFRTFVIREDL